MCPVVGSVGAGGSGTLMRRCRRRFAVAAQTEKDAEEPRPAPTGSVARALKLNDGLFFGNRAGRSRRTWKRRKGKTVA